MSTAPVVVVSDVSGLRQAVRRANSEGGLTIALGDGEYRLDAPLSLSGDGITIRGRSGERDRVILRGAGMTGGVSHIFQVSGSGVTLADLTAGWVTRHVVQVHAESDADDFHAHNVRFVDAAEQLVKVSYREGGPQADNGIVEWCVFEFTAGHAHQSYTGGLGALGAKGWTVRHNLFRDIRVPPGASGQATAISFRRASEGTRIDSNVIVNADSGIRLGLIDGEHGPGVVVNNLVHVVRDVGISLEKARDVLVAHNTVWAAGYPNAIEYRFPESHGNRIVNNLLHGTVQRRDGGDARVEGNLEHARADWFIDAARGDLRLARGVPEVVDRAVALTDIDRDVECDPRPAGLESDIGADEYLGFVEAQTGGWAAWWHRIVDYAARAPDRVLYRGASLRSSPAQLAATAGIVAGGCVGLVAYGWLARRSRRGGRPRRRLRDAAGALGIAAALAIAVGATYVVLR